MTLSFDPERHEINALLELAGDLQGKRVFEIGTGSGRLTWRYAPLAGQVLGIDPKPQQVARALEEIPADLRSHVTLLQGGIEDYQHDYHRPPFDLALMSWSL